MPLSRYVIFCFLFVGLAIFGGCGDDDPTDEWVGTWTLETWNGNNWEGKSVKIAKDVLYKAHIEAGNTKEMWDMFVGEIEVTVKFTFESNSRWEHREDVTVNPSSYTKKNRNNPNEYVRTVAVIFMDWFKLVNRLMDRVATGSYIVSEDNFVMTGDSSNTGGFTGIMSGLWKRTGSKLTLIGDSDSGLGTIVFSK